MTKSIAKKSTTGSLPPAVPHAITPTFSPWTHTSADSYIYQLSLVLATATVSFSACRVLCGSVILLCPLYPLGSPASTWCGFSPPPACFCFFASYSLCLVGSTNVRKVTVSTSMSITNNKGSSNSDINSNSIHDINSNSIHDINSNSNSNSNCNSNSSSNTVAIAIAIAIAMQ